MTKPIVAFRNFVNAPNLTIIPLTVLTNWPFAKLPHCFLWGKNFILWSRFNSRQEIWIIHWKKPHRYFFFSELFPYQCDFTNVLPFYSPAQPV
jgi:hypothetical protein